MTLPRAYVVEEVRRLVSATPVTELPELLGQLEAERLRGLVRIHAPAGIPTTAQPEAEESLLTMGDVAARLGVSLEHARELGRRGELPTVRVGERYVRVRRAALEAFVAERERSGNGLRVTPAERHRRGRGSRQAARTSPRAPGILALPALADLDPRQRRGNATAMPDDGTD
jgi:excisionase family DNA binding protein